MAETVSLSQLLAALDSHNHAGFAVGLHIKFTSPTHLIQTYPVAWNEHYSKNGLVMADPAVAWGVSNEGFIRWSDLIENDRAGVFAAAAEHGLKFGAMVSVLQDGSRSIGGFARADQEFSDAELQELVEIVAALHTTTADAGSLSADDAELLASRSAQV